MNWWPDTGEMCIRDRSIYRRKHNRFLAQMAYDTWNLVSRVRVHSAWRESRDNCKAYQKLADCLGTNWCMAPVSYTHLLNASLKASYKEGLIVFDFEKPKIEIKEMSEDNRYGKFVVEPLERGYGITLGNSLRRIMLSSLPGAAVSQIKIEGVLHELSLIHI